MHKDALEKLVNTMKNFKMAEKYCEDQNDLLLTKLFGIYV